MLTTNKMKSPPLTADTYSNHRISDLVNFNFSSNQDNTRKMNIPF